jgi:hypothetical protein
MISTMKRGHLFNVGCDCPERPFHDFGKGFPDYGTGFHDFATYVETPSAAPARQARGESLRGQGHPESPQGAYSVFSTMSLNCTVNGAPW